MAMQGYDRDGYQDYSEYEDDVEEEGEEEYEEEEEAPQQPTQEELKYLELRQRLKDDIRKQRKGESGSSLANSQDKKKILPYENFGSFFGPSNPVIAQRVIQESKSLLENHHMAAKVAKPYHEKSKSSASTTAGSKSQVHNHRPKAVNELKTKVQKLKDTRDYSFLLSDDAQAPAPRKDPPPRSIPARNYEARSAQVPARRKQSLNNTGRQVPNGREERKPASTSSQMHPKAGPPRMISASKPIQKTVDPRKQIGNSNGSGPGRPLGPKSLPSKMPASTTERRVSAAGVKSSVPSVHKPPASKLQSSASKHVLKQPLDMKKEFQESSRAKVQPKQPVPSSKPQINKPPVKISSRPTIREDRPKKKPARRYSDDEDDDGGSAISMIRSMFGYNPNKYVDDDDDDDMDMEANFDDIMREEKRSARIARKEDEEELRKIEEEERRERLRKEAKKRKLSQR